MARRWRAAFLGTVVLGAGACDGTEPAPVLEWAPESSRSSERPEGDLPIRHALARAASEMERFLRTATAMPDLGYGPLESFEGIEARIADVRSGLAGLTRRPESSPTRGYEESARQTADIECDLEVLKLTSLATPEDFVQQAKLDLYVVESDIRRLFGELPLVRELADMPADGGEEARLRARVADVRLRLSEMDIRRFEGERVEVAEAIGHLRRDVRLTQLLRAGGRARVARGHEVAGAGTIR